MQIQSHYYCFQLLHARLHALTHAHNSVKIISTLNTPVHEHFQTQYPANKEPFLNQLARVILVHTCYCSSSTCFHVYSRELILIHMFCLLSCVLNEFDTSHTGSELVWLHWYVSSREKLVISRKTCVDTPNLFTESGEFMYRNM